jgi:hypothetical protein
MLDEVSRDVYVENGVLTAGLVAVVRPAILPHEIEDALVDRLGAPSNRQQSIAAGGRRDGRVAALHAIRRVGLRVDVWLAMFALRGGLAQASGVTYVGLDDGVRAGGLERRGRAGIAQRHREGERHVAGVGSGVVVPPVWSEGRMSGCRIVGFVEKAKNPAQWESSGRFRLAGPPPSRTGHLERSRQAHASSRLILERTVTDISRQLHPQHHSASSYALSASSDALCAAPPAAAPSQHLSSDTCSRSELFMLSNQGPVSSAPDAALPCDWRHTSRSCARQIGQLVVCPWQRASSASLRRSPWMATAPCPACLTHPSGSLERISRLSITRRRPRLRNTTRMAGTGELRAGKSKAAKMWC